MSVYDSDIAIMDNTQITGDVYTFRLLGLTANLNDSDGFNRLTTWCNYVRRANERKESEATAGSGKKSALQGSDKRANGGTEDDAGGRGADTPSIPLGETSLEAFVASRLSHLKAKQSVLTMDMHGMSIKLGRMQYELKEVDGEIKRMEEVLPDGTPQDVSPVGGDIHREVPKGGEGGSGAVGDEDSAEELSQGAG